MTHDDYTDWSIIVTANNPNNEIVLTESGPHPLIDPAWLKAKASSPTPYLEHKDSFSRIRRFLLWADSNNINWMEVQLADYRDHLVADGLQVKSISSKAIMSLELDTMCSYPRSLSSASLRSVISNM